MASPLPLLLFGGAALVLLSGKKKKKKSKPKTSSVPSDTSAGTLPAVDDDVPFGVDEDLDAAEQQAPTAPTPTITPTITPSGPAVMPAEPPPSEPEPPPSEPEPLPELGPTGTGSCANPVYSREPVPLAKVPISPRARTMFPPEAYHLHIKPEAQQQIFNELIRRFEGQKKEQERRTVSSVVLRETLKKYNQNCAWETPVEGLSEPEQLVWDSARRLMMMAQVTVGVEDPGFSKIFQTGERYTVSRDALRDPDPGFMTAQNKPEPGRRIEIIATDKTLEHAEHIIGKIEKLTGPNGEPNLFEVRIVDIFQGEDVKPRLRTKHGFKSGSNAFFSQKGPTGIYRIFPQGMV